MTDIPADWFMPGTDNGERCYWLTRDGIVFLTMSADGKVATQAKVEIAQIVTAWYRGEIFPRFAAPTMVMLLDLDPATPQPPDPAPAPIEIAGGVAGLQKHLIEVAKQNRGLDHAALKQLFNDHQVVMAVWESSDAPGPGFLTLKGVEHLLTEARRNPKKIRATMTAFWCNSREHAEILQQAFTGSR
jgi:hypothetical protein